MRRMHLIFKARRQWSVRGLILLGLYQNLLVCFKVKHVLSDCRDNDASIVVNRCDHPSLQIYLLILFLALHIGRVFRHTLIVIRGSIVWIRLELQESSAELPMLKELSILFFLNVWTLGPVAEANISYRCLLVVILYDFECFFWGCEI